MTIQQDHDARVLDNIYERNKARIREIDAVLDEIRPLLAKLGREREECIAITRRTEHPPTLSYGVLNEMATVAANAFENSMTPRGEPSVGCNTRKEGAS